MCGGGGMRAGCVCEIGGPHPSMVCVLAVCVHVKSMSAGLAVWGGEGRYLGLGMWLCGEESGRNLCLVGQSVLFARVKWHIVS